MDSDKRDLVKCAVSGKNQKLVIKFRAEEVDKLWK